MVDIHAALSVVVVDLIMLYLVGGNTLVGVLLVDVEFMKHHKRQRRASLTLQESWWTCWFDIYMAMHTKPAPRDVDHVQQILRQCCPLPLQLVRTGKQ